MIELFYSINGLHRKLKGRELKKFNLHSNNSHSDVRVELFPISTLVSISTLAMSLFCFFLHTSTVTVVITINKQSAAQPIII